MIGRPIQNAMTRREQHKDDPDPEHRPWEARYPISGSVSVPDRFHRIAVNEIIDVMARTAPNSSVAAEVLYGALGSGRCRR